MGCMRPPAADRRAGARPAPTCRRGTGGPRCGILVLLLGTVGQTAWAQQAHPSRAEPPPTPPSKEASPAATPFAAIEGAPTPAPPPAVPRRAAPDHGGRG